MSHREQRADRLPWWPFGVVFLMPAVIILAEIILGHDFLWFVLGQPLVWIAWTIAAAIGAFRALRPAQGRTWQSRATYLLVLTALLLASFNARRFVGGCNEVGARISFRLRKAVYMDRVMKLSPAQQPHLVVFNRAGMPWFSEGIVYDETDEVLLPPEERSAQWKNAAAASELSCGFTVEPLGDHFYLGYFDC